MDKETFGEVIRQARKTKGISLRELASRIGISHPYLSQLENNHNNNPSIKIIYDLSLALDISFAYLVHISGVDIGIKKDMPDNVLKVLKVMKPGDFIGWNNLDEFKKVFVEKEYLKLRETDNEEDSKKNEEELKAFYDLFSKLKAIESGAIANAILHDGLINIEKDTKTQFNEQDSIDKYNFDVPTPIFLNENNEGNFYFFKEGVEISEEIQEKLRLMIKTILD